MHVWNRRKPMPPPSDTTGGVRGQLMAFRSCFETWDGKDVQLNKSHKDESCKETSPNFESVLKGALNATQRISMLEPGKIQGLCLFSHITICRFSLSSWRGRLGFHTHFLSPDGYLQVQESINLWVVEQSFLRSFTLPWRCHKRI